MPDIAAPKRHIRESDVHVVFWADHLIGISIEKENGDSDLRCLGRVIGPVIFDIQDDRTEIVVPICNVPVT
jgi:hypothetical protein